MTKVIFFDDSENAEKVAELRVGVRSCPHSITTEEVDVVVSAISEMNISRSSYSIAEVSSATNESH